MHIVTLMMRQNRAIQRLQQVVRMDPHRSEIVLGEFAEAVLTHARDTEVLLASVSDCNLARDLEAHRCHHTRAKLGLFRLATSADEMFNREFDKLERVLREHAQHEATLVRDLRRAFGDDVLDDLLDSPLDTVESRDREATGPRAATVRHA